MRQLILLSAFVFACITGWGQKQKRVYLKDVGKGDDREIIYIDNSRKLPQYDWLINYNADPQNRDYISGVKEIKGNSFKPLKRFDLQGLSIKWISLRYYKGKYYMYTPADFCDNYVIKINDSTYSESACEIVPSILLNVERINSNTYKLVRKWIDKTNITTTIHIIDQKKGIAVFENNPGRNRKAPEYWLMIRPECVRLFPMIVAECKNFKMAEWEFNQPDYKKLISGDLRIN